MDLLCKLTYVEYPINSHRKPHLLLFITKITNVASYGNLWDIKHMSTFTTSPSHISNYTVVSLRENSG